MVLSMDMRSSLILKISMLCYIEKVWYARMKGEKENEINNNKKKKYIVREFLYCAKDEREHMLSYTLYLYIYIYISCSRGRLNINRRRRKYNMYKMQATKVDVMTLDWKLDQDE